QWFYQQLAAGRDVKAEDIEDQWKISEKTAKRDIAGLREKGLIKFIGAAKTGRYQLKSGKGG
ncbi:MAG: HTH domain-containing protein, partial [Mariprofundaceae bacterium]|nr:HTH domain-containing protein [Mariprofundaceae bacterium]